MLSLTIFAAAASAAAQPAPASRVEPPSRPSATAPESAGAKDRPPLDRRPTVWRFTDPGVDGGQIWL